MAISGRENTIDPLAQSLKSQTRASMLIEIVEEQQFWEESAEFVDPSEVAVLFGFVFPFGSAPHKGRIAFQTRH